MTIDRRGFLRAGAMTAAAFGLGNGLSAFLDPLRAAASSTAGLTAEGRVLVVVNLFGGNDGLNTVIPIAAAEYDRYRLLRPTLR